MIYNGWNCFELELLSLPVGWPVQYCIQSVLSEDKRIDKWTHLVFSSQPSYYLWCIYTGIKSLSGRLFIWLKEDLDPEKAEMAIA